MTARKKSASGPRRSPGAAAREVVYAGRHLEFCRRERSGRGWEFVSRRVARGVVGIVAVDGEGRLLLVEQWREPVGANAIELPAGLAGDAGDDPGETLLRAAQRELREETGCDAEEWRSLAEGCSSAGLTDEMVSLFLAMGLRQVVEREVHGVGQERIRLHRVRLCELLDFLAAKRGEGTVVDFKIYAGVYLARPFLAGLV